MGRKSNAKKIIREMLDEKEEKENLKKKSKKKVRKTVKKEIKAKEKAVLTKPEKKKEKKFKKLFARLPKLNRNQKVAICLALIFTSVLFTMGFFLFERAFRAKPIAKFLPADKTIALIELNIDQNHNQILKTFELIKNHPIYSKENIIHHYERWSGQNFKQNIEPWIGRQLGFAITKGENRNNIYYFAEISDTRSYEKFLKDQENTAIIGSYHVSANSPEAISALKEQQKFTTKKLFNSHKYSKVNANLPVSRIAHFYLDFDNLNAQFFKDVPFLSEKGFSLESIKPLLPVLDAEGMALLATDSNFALQSYLKLDPKIVDEFQYLERQIKYQANLTKYVSSEALAFWGGRNLESQITRLIEILAGKDQTNRLIVDSMLNQSTQKYLGRDINFYQDIVPLFRNEFAFAIEEINGEKGYKFLVELSELEEDLNKITDLVNSFALLGGAYQNKVVEHVLPDGTVAREIIAVPEEVRLKETNYKNYKLQELELGGKQWGIYYSAIDNVAVLTTHRDLLIGTIDSLGTNERNLQNSTVFEDSIIPVMRNADEVAYLNMNKILLEFFANSEIPGPFKLISSFTSGRNYFNDGIITVNYFDIK